MATGLSRLLSTCGAAAVRRRDGRCPTFEVCRAPLRVSDGLSAAKSIRAFPGEADGGFRCTQPTLQVIRLIKNPAGLDMSLTDHQPQVDHRAQPQAVFLSADGV